MLIRNYWNGLTLSCSVFLPHAGRLTGRADRYLVLGVCSVYPVRADAHLVWQAVTMVGIVILYL
jgi:hypothetical protein